MIFTGRLVELPVIDAHSPSCDGPLRYELISLILDQCHATLLGNHLNGTDPFTILHGVDDTGVQELQHFFLDYLPHRIIQPSLMLSRWLMVWFHRNAMGA